jgi:hypothetical protein
MEQVIRRMVVSSVLALAVLIAGCSEDNEKSSGITGKAYDGGPSSYADGMARAKGGVGGMQGGNYPGAKKQEAKVEKAQEAKKEK